MDIEVFIIGRNKVNTIENCIKSLIKYFSYNKIALIDNLSDDGTAILAANMGIKVIKNENIGVSFSRNLIFDIVNSEFFIIIDADLELISFPKDDIKRLFSDHANLLALCGNYNYKAYVEDDYDILMTYRRKYLLLKDKTTFIYDYQKLTTFSGGFCIIKYVKNFEKVPYLENSSGEDFIWQLMMLKKGYSFGYLASLIGVHDHNRKGTKNISNKINQEINGIINVQKFGCKIYLIGMNYFPIYIYLTLLFLIICPIISIITFIIGVSPFIYILLKERKAIFILKWQIWKDILVSLKIFKFKSLEFIFTSQIKALIAWIKNKNDI